MTWGKSWLNTLGFTSEYYAQVNPQVFSYPP